MRIARAPSSLVRNARIRRRLVPAHTGRGIVLPLAAMLAFSLPASAEIYKCVDSAGRVTYQQTRCPASAKGGRVELFVDNGSSRGAPDEEALWEAAVRDHIVVVGMPRAHVIRSLGNARDMRPGPPGEGAAEVWSYPRDDGVLRIGFARGLVVWQRTDTGAAEASPQDLARAAARAEIARGQNCIQVLADVGNATSEEDVSPEPGTVSRRYTWEPVPGDAHMRTTVLCINGQVAEVERQNAP